jgi:hypothetical protein
MIPKESRIDSIWFSFQQSPEQVLAESERAILGKVLNFAASYPYSNLDMVCAVVTYSRPLLVSDTVFRWKIRSIISLHL